MYRILMMLPLFCIPGLGVMKAEADESEKWRLEVGERREKADKAAVEVIEGITEKYGDIIKKEKSGELKIFVSSSMPKEVLREYVIEAKRYEGVLIFRGLPAGSFEELRKLIAEITADTDKQRIEAGIQIDDEAYAKFGIEEVPSFILSGQGEGEFYESRAGKHDKISGNIGVAAALEKFAADGDLAEEAKERLGRR